MKLPKLFKAKEKKPTVEQRLKDLELEVGIIEPKEEKTRMNPFDYVFFSSYNFRTSLVNKVKQLRTDFEELDKKFDALERYLQIELIKGEEQTQTYDWADKKEIFEFRKAKKTYEEVKKEKTQSYNDED